MITLEEWILTESNINYAGWFKDGTIIVYINGKRYEYLTDAFYHEKWKNMIRYSPFRVLNQIKKQVDNGKARLVSAPQVQ